MERAGESEGPHDRQGKVNHGETDASRREMLAKIGRFAYAAPALTLLVEPKSVQAYGGGWRRGYGYGDKNHNHSGPLGLKKKK